VPREEEGILSELCVGPLRLLEPSC
jgi:hypothetical protein